MLPPANQLSPTAARRCDLTGLRLGGSSLRDVDFVECEHQPLALGFPGREPTFVRLDAVLELIERHRDACDGVGRHQASMK